MLKIITEKCLEANAELNKYFTNKDISLDQRWSEFNSLPESLKKMDWGFNLKFPDCVVQDMNWDKGTVLSFNTLIENFGYMKEDAESDEGDRISGPSKRWLKNMKIEDIQEQILARGYQSFVHTW